MKKLLALAFLVCLPFLASADSGSDLITPPDPIGCVECYTDRIVDQGGQVLVCEICAELDPSSHGVVTSKITCRPE